MSSADVVPEEDDLEVMLATLRAECARVAVDLSAFVRLARRELHTRMPGRYAPPAQSPDGEEPTLSMDPRSALRILQSLPDDAGSSAFLEAWCRDTFPARPA